MGKQRRERGRERRWEGGGKGADRQAGKEAGREGGREEGQEGGGREGGKEGGKKGGREGGREGETNRKHVARLLQLLTYGRCVKFARAESLLLFCRQRGRVWARAHVCERERARA